MTRTVVAFTDSTAFGGAEQALLQLLIGLDKQRWHPVLAHHPAAGLAPLLEGARNAGIALWAVPEMPPGKNGLAPTLRFARALRARKPDVFHAHLTWQYSCRNALLASWLAGVPARIATVQLTLDVPFSKQDTTKLRLLSNGVGRYIAVSNHAAQHLHATTGIDMWRIDVIHNAVSLPEVSRCAQHALEHNQPALQRTVLTVARLDSQKGLHILIEAAAHVPDVQFVIAGEGVERAALQEQIARLGLSKRVHLLGYRSDIADLLARCDVFVLPSFYEGLPLAVLEAMAHCKPVIATTAGGIPEAITSGVEGLLVPPGDPCALAAAICDVLSDAELSQRMAVMGRRRIESDFSAATMIARVMNVYESVLDTRGRTLESNAG